MQKSLVALSTIAALGLMACQPSTTETEVEKPSATSTEMVEAVEMTESQKQAYAMGASMGLFANDRAAQQAELEMPLDMEALKQGFNDGLGDTLKFTPQEIQQFAQQAQQALMAKQQEMEALSAQRNIDEGIAYLEENGKREGVVTTESGLQYEVLTQGDGASPLATDTVKVHYRGTLLDGTEFDSSYSRGEPISFPLNQVISGWTEGVQLMKEGSTFRFHIPSDLAYGERATGAITPNSTLIFDVELLEVIKPEAETDAE